MGLVLLASREGKRAFSRLRYSGVNYHGGSKRTRGLRVSLKNLGETQGCRREGQRFCPVVISLPHRSFVILEKEEF